MQFDIFFSICQAEIDGYLPSERKMWQNFFEQVEAADALGYPTAWIAESHLSCEIQKLGESPVIPNFQGEIGLNTDVLLLAQKVFERTRKIEVGSAIRSILVNGGPIAHAEAVRSFLSLHSLNEAEQRKIHLGFAAGRFKFSSEPYGILPRSRFEALAWNVVKGKIFLEATEIFLRLVKGEVFSSSEVSKHFVSRADFRSEAEWHNVLQAAQDDSTYRSVVSTDEKIALPSRWNFQKIGLVPKETPLQLLRLLVGSHDQEAQILANKIMPCGVFNLSITPSDEIERTHLRMQKYYDPKIFPEVASSLSQGWERGLMPRTVLVFLNADPMLSELQQRTKAQIHAQKALRTYWNALEGTLDEERIKRATENALVGNPEDVAMQIAERFHSEDRLMLWFDFFNHNCAQVIESMESFKTKVVPRLLQKGIPS